MVDLLNSTSHRFEDMFYGYEKINAPDSMNIG